MLAYPPALVFMEESDRPRNPSIDWWHYARHWPAIEHLATTAESVKNSQGDESIFTNDVVLKIQIEIPEAGMAIFDSMSGTGSPSPANAFLPRHGNGGTVVYTNVALHLKGGRRELSAVDDKPV